MIKALALMAILFTPCFALAEPPHADFDEFKEIAAYGHEYIHEEADEAMESGYFQCDLQAIVQRFDHRFYSNPNFSVQKAFRGSGNSLQEARLNSFALYFQWLRGNNYFGSNHFTKSSFSRCW